MVVFRFSDRVAMWEEKGKRGYLESVESVTWAKRKKWETYIGYMYISTRHDGVYQAKARMEPGYTAEHQVSQSEKG
jgi:hypothetical protein